MQNQQQYQPQTTQAFKPVASVEPPPSTITLRPKAPVSQAPPPVFNSQPATATLKGENTPTTTQLGETGTQ